MDEDEGIERVVIDMSGLDAYIEFPFFSADDGELPSFGDEFFELDVEGGELLVPASLLPPAPDEEEG